MQLTKDNAHLYLAEALFQQNMTMDQAKSLMESKGFPVDDQFVLAANQMASEKTANKAHGKYMTQQNPAIDNIGDEVANDLFEHQHGSMGVSEESIQAHKKARVAAHCAGQDELKHAYTTRLQEAYASGDSQFIHQVEQEIISDDYKLDYVRDEYGCVKEFTIE